MEIFFNFAWALLALVSVCLWMRFERRTGADRHLPMIALAMLLIILFPVISVSDDLWSIQNPAETDTCVRRDHIAQYAPSLLPVLASPPATLLTLPTPDVSNISAQTASPARANVDPSLDGIENRPPPAA